MGNGSLGAAAHNIYCFPLLRKNPHSAIIESPVLLMIAPHRTVRGGTSGHQWNAMRVTPVAAVHIQQNCGRTSATETSPAQAGSETPRSTEDCELSLPRADHSAPHLRHLHGSIPSNVSRHELKVGKLIVVQGGFGWPDSAMVPSHRLPLRAVSCTSAMHLTGPRSVSNPDPR